MASIMFVCLKCRSSRRYRVWKGDNPVCQFCSFKMMYAYYKFKMPPEKDDKGWNDYIDKCRGFNRDMADTSIKLLTAQIEKLRIKAGKINHGDRAGEERITQLICDKNDRIKYYLDNCYY